ncbi:MAG: RIP metalloprotease RseP [Lachnospiraceae bacterium]|nr:RIP metalloprotease RseP [Lachnospiraceae bacterium]
MNIIVALIVFSILVFFHELGHMLLAKKNKIGVTEFSIGMGPRLFSFNKGGTKYSLKLIPFGGSCMMVGEMEDSDVENAFNNRSVWARFSVVAAGPIFNIILALILAIFVIGLAGYDPAVITYVEEGSAAYEAGLRVGDRIVEYDGTNVIFGREIYLEEYINPINDSPIEVRYERDGEKYTAVVRPKRHEQYYIGMTYDNSGRYPEILSLTEGGALATAGAKVGDKILSLNGMEFDTAAEFTTYLDANPLKEEPVDLVLERGGETISVTVVAQKGVSYSTGFYYNMYRIESESPLKTLKYGLWELKYQISSVYKSLKMLIVGDLGMDDLAGPVGIVDMVGTVVEESQSEDASTATNVYYVFLNLANLTMMLSVSLGIMNLLPIPALDGGRLVFILIEAIRGKPLDRNKEGIVHIIGFALLMILMVAVLFNDIQRLFN